MVSACALFEVTGQIYSDARSRISGGFVAHLTFCMIDLPKITQSGNDYKLKLGIRRLVFNVSSVV